jgi:uncharacterized membrane protein
VQKQITVNRPVDELYSFWRDFQKLPQIMNFLDSVEVNGQHSHWKATAPADIALEWDIEIVEDRPNEAIAWRSVEGAKLENSGSVSFKPAPSEWGTEVTLNLDFNPPGGVLGDIAAGLFGATPDMFATKALPRFKAIVETGEIPTTKSQPAARNDGRDK